MSGAVLDNKPPFTPLAIPRMLTDPMVQFGLNQWIGPLTLVEWDVKATNPEVKAFVLNTAKKFWRRSMPLLAFNGLAWGYAPGIHEVDQSETGEYRFERTRWVSPPDATALKWKAGERRGELAGFRLVAGVDDVDDVDDGLDVLAPFAAWYGGLERLKQFYDWPRLRAAYEPWLEKNTRGGALNSRRLYFHTHAFRGQVIYHPPGYVNPNDPSSGENRDYALYLADTLRNGSSLVFPDIRTPGENRDEPAWRIEPIEGNAQAAINILEYTDNIDKEILIGIGIPPEVVEASETGSGFSGRQIPFLSLMTQADLLTGPLVGCVEPVIREMVNHNYDGAEFTLDTVPLAETVKRQNDPNAKSFAGQMGGAPPAGASPDAAMAGSGGGTDAAPGGGDQPPPDQGGDPSAGGLVPYVGKKGGRGKKDPYTGRVYYMSHAGSRLGCLMADIPDPLASACLSFAQSIPPEHFIEDGRETHPHVTLHYGLTQLDPSAVLKAVSDLGSLSFAPGVLKVFEKDDCDVLYVSCDDEAQWRRWHRHTESLPHEPSEYDDYVPHLTLAYLRKGKGKLYAGKTALRGEPVPVSTVVYSGPDGRESRAQVWPSADELAEAFAERVDLAWNAARSSHGTLRADWDGEGGVDKKSQYGENARRALAGESLIARRAGDERPVAERLMPAERLKTAEKLPLVAKAVKTAEEVSHDDRGNVTKPGGTSPPKPPVVAKRPTPPPPPKPPMPPPAPQRAKTAPTPKPPLPKVEVSAGPVDTPLVRPVQPKGGPSESKPKPGAKPYAAIFDNPRNSPSDGGPDDPAWVDEYRTLKNLLDAGDKKLTAAQLQRLAQMEVQFKRYIAGR
jgi:2'-5' RNA ligase